MPESFAFRITGIEPRDAQWRAADASLRREFWRAVVVIGLKVKDQELAAGFDRHGAPMHAIAASTRAHRRSAKGVADPNAPPLTPAYGLSRTRSLLTGRAHANYAEFFWKYDEVLGVHWGRVLGYHRKGGGHLPKRDVIGISPVSLTSIHHQAQVWWEHRKRGVILGQAVEQFQLPAASPAKSPPKIPVVGRTDFHNFTFGVNGDIQLAERATEAGLFTGFRQFHAGGSMSAGGVPIPTKPASAAARVAAHPPQKVPPRPNFPTPNAPVPAKVVAPRPVKPFARQVTPPDPAMRARPTPKVASPPGPGSPAGVEFTPSRAAKAQRMATVWVDVAKLDAAFQRDSGFAIGPNGEGAIGGRIEEFKDFLAKAKREGIAIEQSQVVIDKDGSVSFVNGRHRFAVLRDMGAERLPVSVPRSQVERARKFFGAAAKPGPAVPPPVTPTPSPVAAQPDPAPPPAAPAPGEPWTVSPDQARDWVKDSAFPVPLYHRTHPPAKADIEANGINIKKTWGVFGKGLYASTKHEKSFGPVAIEVALDIRNPLVGTGEDLDRLQNEWVGADSPDPAADFRDEVLRRGYDAVIRHFEPIYQGPSGENWVVIMRPETARFVQR